MYCKYFFICPQITPLLESPSKGQWKRREFTVQDEATASEVRVKLWDHHAEQIDESFLGKETDVKRM